MKAYVGSGGTAPSFHTSISLPVWKKLAGPLNRRLAGPHRRNGCCGDEKSPFTF